MMVIGFMGEKGTGKDYACDQFVKELGYTKLHIAEPWIRTQLEDMGVTWEEYNLNKPLYRPEIQARANGPLGRAGNPRVLLDPLLEKYRALLREGNTPGLVVSGLRFTNEAVEFIGMGWLVVRLWLPREERRTRLAARGEEHMLDDPFESEIAFAPHHIYMYGNTPKEGIVQTVRAGYDFICGVV